MGELQKDSSMGLEWQRKCGISSNTKLSVLGIISLECENIVLTPQVSYHMIFFISTIITKSDKFLNLVSAVYAIFFHALESCFGVPPSCTQVNLVSNQTEVCTLFVNLTSLLFTGQILMRKWCILISILK